MNSPKPAATLAAVLALAPSLAAQGLDRHPVTESYAFGSPELAASFDAADVVVVNSSHFSGGSTQWSFFELGLAAEHELDAFSDGTDFYPATGPAITPPASCRVVVVEHTVDPIAMGKPGGVVEPQSAPTGNGAASDTFSFTFASSTVPSAEHASDHLEVTPGPGPQTDLDALGWLEEERFPVYFSLDRPSAAALGVSPADVLVALAPGSFSIAWTASDLGLSPLDDVDAIAVNSEDPLPPTSPDGIVVFSVTPDSPSLTVDPVVSAMGPGGLMVAKAGGPEPWATAAQLDLVGPGTPAPPDNLNGVRITDPMPLFQCEGDQPNIDGTPYDTIRINGSDGGFPRQVHVRPGQPFNLSVVPRNPGNDFCSIWLAPGKPCQTDGLAIPGLAGPFVIAGLGPQKLLDTVAPVQFNGVQIGQQVDFTLHGVIVDLNSLQLWRSNVLTLRVR